MRWACAAMELVSTASQMALKPQDKVKVRVTSVGPTYESRLL
jgi:hypothetical protein